MSIPQSAGGPIESRDDLVRHLSVGSKPRADWRIGTEHEKFVYDLQTHKPLAYEGQPGIRQLLEGMARFGWKPILEGGHIIGLSQKRRLSEPGAGRPVRIFGRAAEDRSRNLRRGEHASGTDPRSGGRDRRRGAGLRICAELGLDEVPVMPKGRYGIMRRYMPRWAAMAWT